MIYEKFLSDYFSITPSSHAMPLTRLLLYFVLVYYVVLLLTVSATKITGWALLIFHIVDCCCTASLAIYVLNSLHLDC